jgi:hypothetical protein
VNGKHFIFHKKIMLGKFFILPAQEKKQFYVTEIYTHTFPGDKTKYVWKK